MKRRRPNLARHEQTGNVPDEISPVLVYDGACALCNAAVRFVVAHDRRGRIRFAPLGGDFSCSLLAQHPELRNVDSIVFVTFDAAGRSRVQTKSDAAMAVAGTMGGLWAGLGILKLLSRPIRNGLYDAIAQRRYRWFGRYDTCPVPPPETRSRFLA